MGRKSKAVFKMKGHTLPGINQKSETVNKKDGRSPSSAFQQKSSPNKIVGLAAGLAAKPIIKGVKNLLNPGGGDDESESKELLEGTGKTIEPVTGFKDSGGGDTTATGTEMQPPGGGDAATNKPDEPLQMKSSLPQWLEYETSAKDLFTKSRKQREWEKKNPGATISGKFMKKLAKQFEKKSPNKKKLKTGTKTTVGGKLNEGTSPHQNL